MSYSNKEHLEKIDLILSYLPLLYAEGFQPIKLWNGGIQNEGGVVIAPEPEYDQLVINFFEEAASKYWTDYNYYPEKSRMMLQNKYFIKTASLHNIKTMITYCARGERFSDGHWGAMIEEGYIKQLLERLLQIRSEI